MSLNLKINWCSYKAALYAVKHWHYSQCMPAGKTVNIGVWENDEFIGVVVFSWGANRHLGTAYNLEMTECCELTRVALNTHQSPVTQIISQALKMLKGHCPGLQLVISYADCDQNHHGGIYIAGNWIYVGKVQTNGGTPRFKINGKVMHARSVGSRGWKQQLEWLQEYVDPNAEKVMTLGKHKYIMPLNKKMRKQILPLRQDVPVRE